MGKWKARTKKTEDAREVVDETKQSRWARTVTAEAAREKKNRWSATSGEPANAKVHPRLSATSGEPANAAGHSRLRCAEALAKASKHVQSNWWKSSNKKTVLPLKATNPEDPVWGRKIVLPGGSPRQPEVTARFGHQTERLSD